MQDAYDDLGDVTVNEVLQKHGVKTPSAVVYAKTAGRYCRGAETGPGRDDGRRAAELSQAMNALAENTHYSLRLMAKSYRRKLADIEAEVADQLAQLEAHRSHPLMQPPILAELDRLQAQASHFRKMCRAFDQHLQQ